MAREKKDPDKERRSKAGKKSHVTKKENEEKRDKFWKDKKKEEGK